jgi:AraC-like DNA-binding protein
MSTAPLPSSLAPGQFYSRIGRRFRSTEVVLSALHHDAPRALPAHAHELGFFSLLVAGAYREEIGRRQVDYRGSTVVFHPPGLTHRDEVGPGGMQLFCVEVAEPLLARVRQHCPLPLAPAVDPAGEMSWLAWRLYRELGCGDALSPLSVEGLTLELVATVGRLQANGERRPPAWLHRLLERLDVEFARPLTLDDLAADTGLHPVHVSRVFRRATGRTLGEHLQARRVADVCRRLLEEDGEEAAGLAEIAVAAGFADQSHCTRVFKRLMGVPPGAFRKAAREGGTPNRLRP